MNACLSVWGVTALVIPARRAARGAADDPTGAVPVRPPPVRSQEHWPVGAIGDGQVDRPGCTWRQRDGDDLAALAGDGQRPVPAFQAQVLDVGTGCFGDPQPVQCEQGDQRMLGRRAEPGGDQQGAEFVAVQGHGMRLVVDSRPPDVRGRGVLEEFFFDGVFVETGDGTQRPGDRGPGPASCLQVAGEAFDVGAADGEQGQAASAAPGGELAHVQRVRLPGQAAVSGEREPFGVAECGLDGDEGGCRGGGHRCLPVRAEAGGGWARRGLSEI
jgi:hypothetical protein